MAAAAATTTVTPRARTADRIAVALTNKIVASGQKHVEGLKVDIYKKSDRWTIIVLATALTTVLAYLIWGGTTSAALASAKAEGVTIGKTEQKAVAAMETSAEQLKEAVRAAQDAARTASDARAREAALQTQNANLADALAKKR